MRPDVVGVYADWAKVVVRWDGVVALKNSQTFRNSYAWFFEKRDAKVICATAFLDLPTYDTALEGRELPK